MKLKEKMKNNNHKKFDKKKLIGTISKKHIKNGSYTMVMSVIFIAVVVVLNMIVNAIPSKYSEIDISSQKRDAERSGQGRNNLPDCTERF